MQGLNFTNIRARKRIRRNWYLVNVRVHKLFQICRMNASAILLIHCSDSKGIIAQVTDYIQQHQGNILYLDQHVDQEHGQFFMRVEWDLDGFVQSLDQTKKDVTDMLCYPNVSVQLYDTSYTPKMAVFVSKESHCLHDILYHVHSGSWQVEIPVIVGNHAAMKELADRYDIPFVHLEINKENKAKQEQKQLEILDEYGVDFVILARYMQIISPRFIDKYPNKIINIHHSFLPAFVGARPYHQAFERGVKFIGATSHYVTADLDAGPIIEQDIVHIDHRNSVEDLIRKGKELEKVVLSRAIYAHLQRKVLVSGNKTVVFH